MITGNSTYDTIFIISMVLVVIVLFGCIYQQSPYGKFAEQKGGVNLNPRFGWWLMEQGPLISFIIFFLLGSNSNLGVSLFDACA